MNSTLRVLSELYTTFTTRNGSPVPALVRLMLLSVTIVSGGLGTKHSHPGTFFEEIHIQGC